MTWGTILLLAGLLIALGGAGASLLVIGGDRRGLPWARGLTCAALGVAGAASVLLMGLILARRYDIAYVYSYTSQDLGFFYRLSAFWAGQQGTFLLWLLLEAVFTVLQIRRSRRFEPYLLLVLLLIQAGLHLLLLVDSPFAPTPSSLLTGDGQGLNPLLQNPWMAFHPPVLFIGYAGLSVPLAYALAALWRRDYDGWVSQALPWTLVGWFFLGLGIYLGAYWAYETLGWGGYWGWDLVENSSLIPWLTGTALLHGLLIQRHRKRLRHGNLILAGGTFLLILYATFLTRSGILSEISTHSFVESDLTPWMIGLLAVAVAATAGLLASRWRDIPPGPVFLSSSPDEDPALEGDGVGTVGRDLATWFSRDFAFLLTILLLLLVGAPIWVGTLVPVLTGLGAHPTKVDEAFYPQATGPLFLGLLLVLSMCPFLGWESTAWTRLRRDLPIPSAVAIAVTVAAWLLGAHQAYSLFFVFLAAFALASNVAVLVRTFRGGVLRLGGYLAHVGLGLLVVGIVASSAYSRNGPTLILEGGRPQEALGYRFTFLQRTDPPEGRPLYFLEVEGETERFTAQMEELGWDSLTGELTARPYIRRYLAHDLYMAPAEYYPSLGEMLHLPEGAAISLDGYTLTLQGVSCDGISAQAYIHVAASEGEVYWITPTLALAEGRRNRPASLPNGYVVDVEQAQVRGPELLHLVQDRPAAAGPYMVTMRGVYVLPHGTDGAGPVQGGVALEFTGPQGAVVVTPTIAGLGTGCGGAAAVVTTGVTVRIDHMDVDAYPPEAWVQVDGVGLPEEPAMVTVRVYRPEDIGGALVVSVIVKPGMNLLWAGGLLLLLGTAVAIVRRWRESRAWFADR